MQNLSSVTNNGKLGHYGLENSLSYDVEAPPEILTELFPLIVLPASDVVSDYCREISALRMGRSKRCGKLWAIVGDLSNSTE